MRHASSGHFVAIAKTYQHEIESYSSDPWLGHRGIHRVVSCAQEQGSGSRVTLNAGWEAGQVRVNVTLPADLLAQLDTLAAALTICRNAAFVDAVRCWVRPVVPGEKPEP